MGAPPLAAVLVLAAGWMTPGYDPFVRTVSRLAEPGLPGAFAVELAISMVGAALLALAVVTRPGWRGGRALLALAGVALLVAAAIRLDPASGSATVVHRLATAFAMVAVAAASFAFASYGRISLAFGVAEVGVLLLGLILLPTTFSAWGAWERCFLALPMSWMVWLAWTSSVSTDDRMNAAIASRSRRGS